MAPQILEASFYNLCESKQAASSPLTRTTYLDRTGGIWLIKRKRARGPPVHILVLAAQSLFPFSSSELPRAAALPKWQLPKANQQSSSSSRTIGIVAPSLDLVQASTVHRHIGMVQLLPTACQPLYKRVCLLYNHVFQQKLAHGCLLVAKHTICN